MEKGRVLVRVELGEVFGWYSEAVGSGVLVSGLGLLMGEGFGNERVGEWKDQLLLDDLR